MSPQYAAPEQLDTDSFGATDTTTDIYQLGAVLYELFTGQPPFSGRNWEVITKIQFETLDPPSEVTDVPPSIDPILLQALATEQGNRYEDVLYLRDALTELTEEN